MARKKVNPTPPKTDEVHQVSPALQAGIDRFVRSLGHVVLVKINLDAARQMAEDLG